VNEILIAAGSNVAKEANVPAAVARLEAQPEIIVLGVSTVLETPAIGADGQPAPQPSYHDVGLRAATTLELPAVRRLLREIETELGRVRGEDKFAPRTIDLDLAYYGERQAAETTGAGEQPLDGDVLRYAHVAIPLAEVAPRWVHPMTGTTLAAIAATFGLDRRPENTFNT
jgi:2-amino-4-hydroxy-6-hydroxymethyldihydropteridine diphosphokinase